MTVKQLILKEDCYISPDGIRLKIIKSGELVDSSSPFWNFIVNNKKHELIEKGNPVSIQKNDNKEEEKVLEAPVIQVSTKKRNLR